MISSSETKSSVSIIVPAHNEGAVIRRCLRSLMPVGSDTGDEIIVVCNGCADDTETIAAAVAGPIRVVNLTQASKVAAINEGIERACGDIVVVVDADIELSWADVKKLSAALSGDNVLAAAPSVRTVFAAGTQWCVRAYYDMWMSLPYVREGMMAAGVYGLNRAGRQRVGRLPDIIADDGYVRASFEVWERIEVSDAVSIVRAPETIADLIRIKTRSRLGQLELLRKFPTMARNERRGRRYVRIVAGVLTSPRRWGCVVPYVMVNMIVRWRARRQLAGTGPYRWERDESSRTGGVSVEGVGCSSVVVPGSDACAG